MDPASLDTRVLAPIVWVALGALAILLGEVFLSRPLPPSEKRRAGAQDPDHRLGVTLAIFGTVALVLGIYTAWSQFLGGVDSVFNPEHPMLQSDPLSSLSMTLLGVGALLSLWLSINYLPALHINHGEYYALMLLATAGMFVLVCAVDMLTLYMGLELMSLPIYALAGFDRRKLRSNEAALKYFLVGSFASAILLYGIALLYGTTGATDFAGLRAEIDPDATLARIGIGLVLVGFAFKVASVPFHQWAPDVYEGAPTSVTAFMSVTVKTASFVAFLRFLQLALPAVGPDLEQVLQVLAALTMIVGNVMAIIQSNLKRMLAYSSIAHAGYVMIGLVTGTAAGHAALIFYLIAYLVMNLGAFGVLIALASEGRECEKIDELSGLARQRPGLAALMTLFVVSLAGIPGTVGFMAKFQLFSAAIETGHVVLVVIAVLATVVSVYYYLRIPVAMYMRDPADDEERAAREPDTAELGVLLVCAAAVLVLGIFPNTARLPALEIARAAAEMLH